MMNNEELQTLAAMLIEFATRLQHVAHRLIAIEQPEGMMLKRINNKTFLIVAGVTAKSAYRWRKAKKIKFEIRNGRITYLVKDVYAFYEKRYGRVKTKIIIANRL